MYKVTIVSSLILAATFFISCSPISGNHPSLKNDITDNTSVSAKTNTYGAYLAGRVAHLRKDYDNAAAYYQQSYSQDQNPELIDKLYIILASQGKVDQSYPYAKKIIESGKDNSFAQMIVAIKQMHDQDYEASIKSLSKNTDLIYKSFINPVLNAWNYAGLNNK